MRKLPSRARTASALLACVAAGCAAAGCASGTAGQAAAGAANGAANVVRLTAQQVPASGGAPLLGYAPGWLRSGCTDTGDRGGRDPLPMPGYSDSQACILRANTDTEVDYYQYAAPAQTRAAYSAASAAGLAGTPAQTGGCPAGGGTGRWQAGAAAIGAITCSARPGGGTELIWDDPRTGIVAIASSPVAIPAALYAFWSANGASIDGSAHQATSA